MQTLFAEPSHSLFLSHPMDETHQTLAHVNTTPQTKNTIVSHIATHPHERRAPYSRARVRHPTSGKHHPLSFVSAPHERRAPYSRMFLLHRRNEEHVPPQPFTHKQIPSQYCGSYLGPSHEIRRRAPRPPRTWVWAKYCRYQRGFRGKLLSPIRSDHKPQFSLQRGSCPPARWRENMPTPLRIEPKPFLFAPRGQYLARTHVGS